MSKALMTIHGFLTDIHDFGRLYDFLTMYDKVVACKIPGHNGKLDFRKFTVENTLKAVLHCYDKLAEKYDTIDVVGFSMGGALATYLCTQRKVNKLVLVAPANKYINFATPLSTLKFYLRTVSTSYSKTVGPLKERIAQTRDSLTPYLQDIKTTSSMAMRRFFPYLNMQTFTVFANIIRTVNKEVEKVSPIHLPTLAFWGELDELVPKTSVEYVSKHFDNLQKIIYPDAGHLLMLTNKDCEGIRETIKFLTDGKVDKEIPPKTDTKSTK